MTIPQDPFILLSFVNTKLRDEYGSLTELCVALNLDEAELAARLGGLDYRYDAGRNQFI